ncbi:MAG TPA: PepSY domain-containing protein [Xanthobacteraceae bacterium]|jgi:hypothetical protein|nr:PepSY domain-containing protein [Xanthobacteraceae bacterium]
MRTVVLAFVVLLATASNGFTGRPLTDDEATRLKAAMTAQGCSGGKMEFDDGKFEVDNAVCADGKTYDLDFDATFQLIKKDLED